VDGERGHEEGELAGDLPALPLHQVLGLGVVGVEQARRRGADHLEALLELLRILQEREPPRVAGVLERHRRDVLRVGIGGERGDEVAAAEGV
jgi:hypothetical protein